VSSRPAATVALRGPDDHCPYEPAAVDDRRASLPDDQVEPPDEADGELSVPTDASECVRISYNAL
jgi:hypothetical protein